MSSTGRTLNDLQQQIAQAKKELDEISKLEQPMPEFINTTNMLRLNEYLTKANEKQSKLLITYEKYAKELGKLVLSASVIKAKLKTLKSRSKSRKILKKKGKRKKKTSRKRTKKKRAKRKIKKRRIKKTKARRKRRK